MNALIVAGLAFGDEGKGAVTDYLVDRYKSPLVVRYNGGPQAAHNVVCPDGRHHTFSQFGSGTFLGAGTFLSKHTLIDPMAMLREAEFLRGKLVDHPMALMTVDPDCVIITPYHRYANREREMQRRCTKEGIHGSVGLGVGEARRQELAGIALRVRDLANADKCRQALTDIVGELMDQLLLPVETRSGETKVDDVLDLYVDWLRNVNVQPWHEVALRHTRSTVIFEGAQGFLLDEKWGFAPHNSWTDCTFGNAMMLCREALAAATRIGVVRSYYTRHGNGPFPTQDAEVAAYSEKHNGNHPWMGPFRTGHFDGVLFNYAVQRAKPDEIYVTHMDVISTPSAAVAYSKPNGDCATALLVGPERATAWLRDVTPDLVQFHGPQRFLDWLTARTGVPVTTVFRGPTRINAERIEREVEVP